MRIGIFPDLNPFDGGIYQYSLTMLRAFREWTADGCEDDFVVFTNEVSPSTLASLTARNWMFKPTRPLSPQQQGLNVLRRIVGEGPHREVWRWLRSHMSRYS